MLLLLMVGLVWVAPAFRDRRFLYGMLFWDALVALLWLLELATLPGPHWLIASRHWHGPLSVSVDQQVEITITNGSQSILTITAIDDLPVALRTSPAQLTLRAPHGESSSMYMLRP